MVTSSSAHFTLLPGDTRAAAEVTSCAPLATPMHLYHRETRAAHFLVASNSQSQGPAFSVGGSGLLLHVLAPLLLFLIVLQLVEHELLLVLHQELRRPLHVHEQRVHPLCSHAHARPTTHDGQVTTSPPN